MLNISSRFSEFENKKLTNLESLLLDLLFFFIQSRENQSDVDKSFSSCVTGTVQSGSDIQVHVSEW